MSERIHPVARMTVVCHRGRGRPAAKRATGLRQRAWWVMREVPRFTLDDLLFKLAEPGMKDAPGNLLKYISALERVGVLKRLDRRLPGASLTSNGHVIWRLARDLGRQAPVWRSAQQGLWDPNASVLIPLLASPPALGRKRAAAAATTGEGL
jgi:hypothetical protein